jgi:hypothetical protein
MTTNYGVWKKNFIRAAAPRIWGSALGRSTNSSSVQKGKTLCRIHPAPPPPSLNGQRLIFLSQKRRRLVNVLSHLGQVWRIGMFGSTSHLWYIFVPRAGTSLSVLLLVSYDFPQYTDFSRLLMLHTGCLKRSSEAEVSGGEFPCLISIET